MKQVSFVVTPEEKLQLAAVAQQFFDQQMEQFKTQSEDSQVLETLIPTWQEVAKIKSIFLQLMSDDIAKIEKSEDKYCKLPMQYIEMSQDDINQEHKEDCWRDEMARFNNDGIWCYTLVVLGEKTAAKGGFIGEEFKNSGYELDFYATAFEKVKEQLPDYYLELVDAVAHI